MDHASLLVVSAHGGRTRLRCVGTHRGCALTLRGLGVLVKRDPGAPMSDLCRVKVPYRTIALLDLSSMLRHHSSCTDARVGVRGDRTRQGTTLDRCGPRIGVFLSKK